MRGKVMSKYLAGSFLVVVLLLAGTNVGHAADGVTERVSVNSHGIAGNDNSGNFDMRYVSGDGRYVVFHSSADNLVKNDTNGTSDIFVHDRETGATEIASVSSSGVQGTHMSGLPEISSDGRYIVFRSRSLNLDPHPDLVPGYEYVFVHDRQTRATELVSISSTGEAANGGTYYYSISSDGNIVVFDSVADNLVPGDTNGCRDVFMHNRITGTTTLVSVNSDGVQANCSPRYGSTRPSVSGDGNRVSFMSGATNLVAGDENDQPDIFVRDVLTGETSIVSVSSAGVQANNVSSENEISLNGRYVSFQSHASNLAIDDPVGYSDIFIHDLETGITDIASFGSSPGCWSPAISADGRHVAFSCGRAVKDIYVKDIDQDVIRRISVGWKGLPADGRSDYPAMSADGTVVAFRSTATNLVPDDTAGFQDVFVTTRQVDAPFVDISAGGISGSPVISGGARLKVVAELRAVGQEGALVDWWAVAKTSLPPPRNFFSYSFIDEKWRQGISPADQGACKDYGPREILNMAGLPAGTYEFFFGIDTIMNGKPELKSSYIDTAKVTITP